MVFVPVRRATLLIPSGPAHNPSQKHLFILLTDPVVTSGVCKETLLVSVSTVKPGYYHDPTCLLYPGDHPFLDRDSFVNYGKARIEETQKLLNGVKNGLLVPRDPLSSEMFARICYGLTQSRHTLPRVLAFYEAATS